MKFAIISDIHYPWEITQNTTLYSNCGYRLSFYETLEQSIRQLQHQNVDALVICGDFFWEYCYFFQFPLESQPDWHFYLNPYFYLVRLRKWLHSKIPLLMIEGNHDTWFESYLTTHEGILQINVPALRNYLKTHYELTSEQIKEVLALIPRSEGQNLLDICSNVFFLRNSGFTLQNAVIYGLPYQNTENNATMESLRDFMAKLPQLKSDSLYQVYICEHGPARDPKTHINALNQAIAPRGILKQIYWGHVHTETRYRIPSLMTHGPFACVMPEANDFQIPIFSLSPEIDKPN